MGCLSPRFVYAECKRYEEQRVKNKSTYWLVFELLWRDYFQFQVMVARHERRNMFLHFTSTKTSFIRKLAHVRTFYIGM